jgi:hypothetical protein
MSGFNFDPPEFQAKVRPDAGPGNSSGRFRKRAKDQNEIRNPTCIMRGWYARPVF